jgi:hypothetical protein
MYFVLLLILAPAPPPAAASWDCPVYYSQMSKEELEPLVLADDDRNLFWEQWKITSPEDATAWNEALIRTATEMPLDVRNPKRIYGLSQREIKALFRKVDRHPVASHSKLKKYTPEGNIGFCFGRALTAMIEALRMGAARETVKKIWLIGGLNGSTNTWGHHVATMVRGKDKMWYVIDTNYSAPMPLATWYKRCLARYKNDGKVQLFMTDAKRFGPEGGVNAGPIQKSTIEDPFYNGYFTDLMKQSRQEAREAMEEKRRARETCAESRPGLLAECYRKFKTGLWFTSGE